MRFLCLALFVVVVVVDDNDDDDDDDDDDGDDDDVTLDEVSGARSRDLLGDIALLLFEERDEAVNFLG